MSVELYRDPNKYAPRAFIEIKRGSIIFHGYQNYSLTRNTVRVSSRDVKLAAKQRLVRKFFTTKFLSDKTLLDIGANAAFFCFWALQNGAKKATALDIDDDYVKMVNSAKEKLEFKDITMKESSITDWTEQADLVTAFALVHWLYSCTADYGSLDAVIKKLSDLTRAVLIVEWIDPKDKAIRFFRHTDYNQSVINSPYDRIAFEDALARHFEDFRVLGSVTPTRIVYAAYKFASRVEITDDLPLLFNKENVVSSRRLTTHRRKKYFSRVYIEENSPFAFKQATGDLAEREGLILSKLDGRYFPRVCDIRKENGYSVVKLENISAIRLYKAIPGISSSFESLGVFCRHCLNILGELSKKGIIHRDVRAENIFIRDDGSPVLMDFGWAIAGGYPCITPRGLEEGEGCPPDKKFCDVYAMGIIFKRVNRGIYPQLKPLIYAMTQKDGSKRITNIPALMEMLDRILSGGTGEDLTGDAKSFIEKHGLASIIEMLKNDNILELP